MYKFDDRQLSIYEFGQPVGMKLSENNRWVKKAAFIPWGEIEKKYAKLFLNRNGNVAKPLRLALGACIIQAEYGYSDIEVALQIQEGAYLQFFCGYKEYDDSKMPFDPSLMVHFRKRLTPEILGEINEMILREQKAQAELQAEDDDNSNDDDNDETPNSGTMIVDATCAPSNIKYPQDAQLLNNARERTETFIDRLHCTGETKPRTYRQRAHKDFLTLVRCRKPSAKKIRKAIGKQLNYLSRNIHNIDEMLKKGALSERDLNMLDTIRTLYQQQKYMYDHHTHSVPDRIVSLTQPWIRPIVRGKAKAAVEFGAKLDISVVDGWVRLEKTSFDAYNEACYLQETIERFHERTGHYPARVLADKIYRNRNNLAYCKTHNIRLAGPALGRPKKDAIIDKRQNYLDECERVEVERQFSLAKRKCGLGLITTKLKETSSHCIAISILVLNLRKVLYALFYYFVCRCQLSYAIHPKALVQ